MKPEASFTKQTEQFAHIQPKGPRVPADDGRPWIELVTGGRFYFDKPEFDIGAVAHSLSMQCRFTGQCRKFYSVAEHSVLVSRIMEDLRLGDPFEGLLHDGVESVLSDVAGPAKAMLKDYKALDKALDAAMRRQFGIPEVQTAGCKKADMLALALEARELLPSKGLHWPTIDDYREEAWQLSYQINGWTQENACSQFMMRMHDIRRRVRGLR